MDLEKLKEKLRKYKKEDIIITDHAKDQAKFRQIDLEEVKENVINPEKLVYVEEQQAKKEGEKKYNCYFAYSENYHHRYAFAVNGKVIIVTIIGINRNWQKAIEARK